MQKLLILQTFHRFVLSGEMRTVPKVGGGAEQVAMERRENFPAGKTVAVPDDVSAEDAAVWIAQGLAQDPAAPGRETETAAA